ncbi:hypothetical protein GCM10010140_64410 [Streptosporangium pseudovulgare]|uniref:Uncharacterized protein n=2 Tax=Streptosporangium pseudovulgare TaxID=35765 RepID=A0ABQ2RDE4_9ACTN|nr:hypothetical protein GCM10010140_64410 [Streptosporangium pseudovulgare]
MANRVPPTEHRKIGRKLAALAGAIGSEVARSFRKTGVPAYDKGIVSAMGQPFGGWDSEADAVLWYLLRLFITGELLVAHVPLGMGPSRDKERRRNQKVLDEALSRQGIVACVDQEQQGAGYDGHIHLLSGWRARRLWFEVEKDSFRFRSLSETIGPLAENGGIPLEIGYTDPTRTFMHLREYGGVVRWPYGSDGLYLLALREGKETDLQDLFEADWKSRSEGTFINTINNALMQWLYRIKIIHFADSCHVDDEQIDTLTLAAAMVIQKTPLAMFVHIARESSTQNAGVRIVVENNWTKVIGQGVTVYAKKANPGEDCEAPWDLASLNSSMPYSRLRAKVEADADPRGTMIAVPPHRAGELLRIATGSLGIEHLPMLFGAVEALESNGINIGKRSDSDLTDQNPASSEEP